MRLRRRDPEALGVLYDRYGNAAYDLALRARALLERDDRGANREARALLAKARELAPEYGEVLVLQGWAETQRAQYGWIEDPADGLRRSEDLLKRALA